MSGSNLLSPGEWQLKVLFAFLFLQAADLVSTVGALSLGGVELNPLIAQFMTAGPIAGLVLSKAIVLGIGLSAAASGRYIGLRWANIGFAVIVTWNLTVIGRLMFASGGAT